MYYNITLLLLGIIVKIIKTNTVVINIYQPISVFYNLIFTIIIIIIINVTRVITTKLRLYLNI